MKSLLALLGIAAVIGFAAPAFADPDEVSGGDDAGFLSALQRAGITYSNPAQAIGAGRAVCSFLEQGESGLSLVQEVKARNPGFDMDAASHFAVISARYYCPHHLGQA